MDSHEHEYLSNNCIDRDEARHYLTLKKHTTQASPIDCDGMQTHQHQTRHNTYIHLIKKPKP